MKDDIKSQTNNPAQFKEPASSPSKVVDGIQPPQGQNNQNAGIQNKPNEASQTVPNQQPVLNAEIDKSSMQKQPPITKKPQKKISALPVIMAIIILLALSSLAIYAGLIKNNGNDNKASSDNSSSAQTGESQKAEDDQEIQEAISQIDSLPDEQDSSGEGLEDNQLGL